MRKKKLKRPGREVDSDVKMVGDLTAWLVENRFWLGSTFERSQDGDVVLISEGSLADKAEANLMRAIDARIELNGWYSWIDPDASGPGHVEIVLYQQGAR